MIHTYVQQLRSFHRDVRLFLITAALEGFSIAGIRTVLFNLYLLRLGYGPEFVGLTNAVGWVALSGFSPIAGALGTRWGNRRALLGGIVLMSAGTGLLPMAEWVPVAWQVVWLLACTVLTYMGLALYFVNGVTFVMGVTQPEQHHQAIALQVAFEPLAGFAGSLVGGALPGVFAAALNVSLRDPAPYRYPQFLAALLLIPGVLALRQARDVRTTQPGEGPATTNQAPYALIAMMTITVMLRIAGRSAVGVFFNVYLDTELLASTALIGALSAAALLLSVPAALAATSVVRRWGAVRTIAVLTLGMAASILPLALIPRWTAAGLGFMGLTAGFAITTGPFRVFSQRTVAPRYRGAMAGATMTGVGLTNVAMSLAGGYGVGAVGFRGMFLLSAALTVAGALLFWAYFRVPRGELARPVGPRATD